jgi:predicted O-methyltransferase YrrM
LNEPGAIFQPLAGFALDLVRRLRNQPHVPHSLSKLQNLKTCKRLTGARTAVEIGSFKGVTTRRLARIFENVVSVEIVPELHEIAKAHCRGCSNVELLLGDGAKLLPSIAARVDRAVIFLDGHFSGGKTGQGDEPEPVLKELDLIAPHLKNFSAIVVDDFRLFGVEDGWPQKAEVLAKLETVLRAPTWQHFVLNDQYLCVRT